MTEVRQADFVDGCRRYARGSMELKSWSLDIGLPCTSLQNALADALKGWCSKPGICKQRFPGALIYVALWQKPIRLFSSSRRRHVIACAHCRAHQRDGRRHAAPVGGGCISQNRDASHKNFPVFAPGTANNSTQPRAVLCVKVHEPGT